MKKLFPNLIRTKPFNYKWHEKIGKYMTLDNLGLFLFILFLSCLGFGIIGVFYKCITSSSEVEFCYVELYSQPNVKQQVLLRASIDWKDDKTISVFDTYQDAIKAAEDLKCPLMKK